MNTPALTPPPDPLPVQWQRAIANSIASELRHPWRLSRATRPYRPPHSRDYQGAAPIKPPAPTSELLWHEAYTYALIEPTPALGIPWIAWHLKQLDLVEALNQHDLMQHTRTIEIWLKLKPDHSGRPASLYRIATNRHGNRSLRRNEDYAPPIVTTVFLTAVTAATIWLPDAGDVDDYLAEYDEINLDTVLELTRYDGEPHDQDRVHRQLR